MSWWGFVSYGDGEGPGGNYSTREQIIGVLVYFLIGCIVIAGFVGPMSLFGTIKYVVLQLVESLLYVLAAGMAGFGICLIGALVSYVVIYLPTSFFHWVRDRKSNNQLDEELAELSGKEP